MKHALSLYAALVFSFICCAACADPRPFNFVHIIVDDLRTEGLKAYGNGEIKTPNLDRLAGEGVVFERAYANFPSCGASRASILTGLRPARNRFTRYDARIDVDAPGVITLPGYLKQNGYKTISLGKVIHARGDSLDAWSIEPWDAKYANDNQTSYFDYAKPENIDAFLNSCKKRGICSPSGDGKGPTYERAEVPDETYIDGKTAVAAIAALEELKEADTPFYIAVGFVKPHLPFTAPQKYWDLYSQDQIGLSPATAKPDNAPDQAWHPSGELRDWYDGVPDIPPRWVDNVPGDTARTLRHGYFAAASYSDAQVGKVLDAIERLGLKENTVVILSGDHGYSLGDHTMWNKHSLFTLATQSPLIIRKPGGETAKTVSGVVEYIDLYPTIVELAGLPAPPHLEGKSLAPSLDDVNAPTKSAIFTRYQDGENIHTERYSYSAWFDEDRIAGQMLFDHENDPLETSNLAGHPEYKGVAEDLKRRLETHIAQREQQAADLSASSKESPNILLIMAEDMSARAGAFGDSIAVTPNIDRLAAKGISYPNTFTTAGVCSPSRAAHILGRHQMSVGAQHMRTSFFEQSPYRTVPPNHMKAYPELLRREGYYTFTSWKIDYQFSSVKAGSGPFSIWSYEGDEPSWRGRKEGQPFFGFISLMASHEGQMFPATVAENNATGTRSRSVSPDQVVVPPYYPDSPVIREDIAQHYNNIEYMDQLLGELLDQLESDGLADNTIVIWTTDHGDGLPRAKREVYDSGI
jgi:arylsulfatase A-like enzyme